MPATVLYDGTCGICSIAKKWTSRLDWLQLLVWTPSQSPEALPFGISHEALEERMYFVSQSGRAVSGFAAWKRILLRLPLFLLFVAGTVWLSWWSVLAWVLFFSPLVAPMGERGYDWVARNRYRLPGSTCRIPSVRD